MSTKESELKRLKDYIPAIEAQAVEDFCNREGPLVRINDVRRGSVDFYKCKQLVLEQPKNIMYVEFHAELDVTPELEAKIFE